MALRTATIIAYWFVSQKGCLLFRKCAIGGVRERGNRGFSMGEERNPGQEFSPGPDLDHVIALP